MTDEELIEHFKAEDIVFDMICSRSKGNCNSCRKNYLCESLSPKKDDKNVKVSQCESNVRQYQLYEQKGTR